MTNNIELLKKYIQEEINKKGMDQYKQIEVEFAGLGEEQEIIEAARQIGYSIEAGEGQGMYWVYVEE